MTWMNPKMMALRGMAHSQRTRYDKLVEIILKAASKLRDYQIQGNHPDIEILT
jgi:hypothetical protein